MAMTTSVTADGVGMAAVITAATAVITAATAVVTAVITAAVATAVVTATTDRFSSVISRVYVLDRDAGPSVVVSESAGFRGDPRTRDWLAGYRDAVGAPVRCGLVSAIRCARAIRMSRWIVNVTPKYSSRDAEPRLGLRAFALDEIVAVGR